MFISGWKSKTRKIIILSSVVPSYESLVNFKENTGRKRKKQERRKEKNTDRTQTKLKAPQVMHNVKILPP